MSRQSLPIPLLKNPSPRRTKSSEMKQQNILITFEQNLQELLRSVFTRISKQYASVYIFTTNQQKNSLKRNRNPLQTKRAIKYLYLQPYTELLNSTSIVYARWLHFCTKICSQNQLIKKHNQIQVIVCNENEDNNSLFVKSTKLLHLDFIWLGVGGRLGCSIDQFQLNVAKFEKFQNYQVGFLGEFITKFNQRLQYYGYDLNGSQQLEHQHPIKKQVKNNQGASYSMAEILGILQSCTNYSIQTLLETQKQIQQYICQNYNEHISVSNLTYHNYYLLLKSRNYFKCIWIEQPVHKRYTNFKNFLAKMEIYGALDKWVADLGNFLVLDDYIYEKFLQRVAFQANFVINTGIVDHDYKNIIQKHYQEIFRKFRPDFDQYFISLCQILKLRGGCIKQAAGSIIVKNKRILSTGYNGTPMGSINCYNGGCRVCNDSIKVNTEVLSCNCIHAQYSCIIEAGIQSTPGCTLYTTQLPCLWCAKVICQAKIQTVVYIKNFCSVLSYPNENAIIQLFHRANIKIKEFNSQQKRFSKI